MEWLYKASVLWQMIISIHNNILISTHTGLVLLCCSVLQHQDFINPSCKELEMVAFWCQTIILRYTTFPGLKRTTLGLLNITTGTIPPGVMGGDKGKWTFFAFHLSFIYIQLKCHCTSNCVFYNFLHPLKKKRKGGWEDGLQPWDRMSCSNFVPAQKIRCA